MSALSDRVALPDLVALPEWQVADLLNVPDPALGMKRVDVPTSTARGYLLGTGEWGAIKLLSRATPSAEIPAAAVVAATVAIDTLSLTEVLEATKPAFYGAVSTLLAGLQAAGVLSETSVSVLMAMCEQPMTWAEANGLLHLTATDIGAARAGSV